MESDLPLMEDDSLIQQQFPDPNQTPSKSSVNYFNCSHFKLPPSHTKSLKDGVHLEKPSSSSSETSNNKENINANNVELPKLGMGPMQMKRKKKGGGYNLRKSLAWDRAFFTDEGILDPLELTLITGIDANTCGGGLHTISEEGDSSFSSATRCTKGTKNKETFEEDPPKELQDKSRTSKVKAEKTGCLVGNHDSSPHRKVTHKFLSNDRTNRAGSKVGVLEPLAASSLKRPANSNTLKTTKKESKLPKLPISKPGSLYSATTKGSTTTSQLRHNSIPKPTIKVEKDVALKSSVKNVHGSQNKAKMGSSSLCLPIKEPAKRTVRNLTNSSSKGTSSTKSRLVQVDKANSGSEVVPDRFQLSEIQERSAPSTAKNQAQHITPNLNNSLPAAAMLTSSASYHIERASNGLIISDRLHPCANQEQSATLASSHHMSLQNTGIYPPKTEPARPSGVTSSAPYHIERASNGLIISDRLHPCANQEQSATLASSHHMSLQNTGIYPPKTEPARPSGLRLPSPSLRFFDQRTALESGSLQQKKIQPHTTNMGSNRKIGELRPPVAPARTPMKSNDIIENVCSMVSTSSGRCLPPSILSTHCGSSPLIPLPNYFRSITKGVPDSDIYPNLERNIMQKEDIKMQNDYSGSKAKVHKAIEQEKRTIVLHNEEDRLQNHTAISMSTSGHSFQHQEQNISTAVNGNASFMQDLAQTLSEQEKSDAPKVNLESHLDVDNLKAEGQVRKVFVDPQKDGIAKSENDAGPTKGVGSGSQICSVVMQHINIGQENDVAKVVDDLYKSSHMEDDAGCSADSPCNQSSKCFETTIPCVSALLNSEFNSEGWSVNRIMPEENSSLKEGPCDNVTEINDHFFQEKGRSNYSKAILKEVLDQKQDGVDVALIPEKPFVEARLGFRKVAPLIDDNNHSNLSCRPVVELISGPASMNDNAFCKTESVLQVAECASTYPQSWEKEGLNSAAAAAAISEAEFRIDEENQKSQEMGIIIRSLSRKSIVAEQSQHSSGNMEVNVTIQGCTDGAETYKEFQSENKTLEDSETFNNFPKMNLEDAQMQLLDGDILVQSCSSLTSVLQKVDHSDIFEEQPEFSDDRMKLEKDLISNHQLHPTTDSVPQECVKRVVNVVDQSDVYECDKKPSNTTIHSPPAEQAVGLHHNNNGQLCVEYETSGPIEIDPIAKPNENYFDRQFTYNTECSDLPLISELKSSGNNEMEGMNTCMEYCSSGEESCSFPRKVADSMLEEKATLFGEFGQVSEDNKHVCMESLSPEKNPNLDKPNNALEIVIGLQEQSISHGCDCDLQNSNANAFLPKVQGKFSDLNGEDQPNEPQAFDVIMPSQETCDYVTNERSGNGFESSGQDPSESNSSFPVSQYTTTDGKFTSTAFCSVTVESCSAAGGDKSLQTSTCRIGGEESKISFEEVVETEALQEGKHPMVAEFNHDLDGGSDLKDNKDATKRSNNIKKHDNSLVIHPPNAVPFSDEWLAAIEAAGEEILTMKHGAVQHSPPDKCLPEPSPWSPVKRKGNQIGPYDCTKYTNAMQ